MTSERTDRIIAAAGGGIGATGTHEKITVLAAADWSSALTEGVTYDLLATQDCWICGAPTGSTGDAAANDFYLIANVYVPFTPTKDMLYLSAVRVATDGVLYINRREDQGVV